MRCGLLIVVLAAAAAILAPADASRAVTLRDYDIGRVELDVPGPKGPLPVRLRGVVGLPAVSPGPGSDSRDLAAALDTRPHRPLVIVAHGRHGDGCPAGPFDSETWPCFRRAHRNDLGLRHLVRALARRGMVAVAPDLNGAHTAGWGEPDDRRRWPAIVNRTLAAIFEPNAPADPSRGRSIPGIRSEHINPRRIGIFGHSLSGLNSARFAQRRAAITDPALIMRGRGPIASLYLLAPVGMGAAPDTPTAITLGSCDGDTGSEGRLYLHAARRDRNRRHPLYIHTLIGANHNYFNRLLASRRDDDSPLELPNCRPHLRPSAAAQQLWIDRAVGDFFATTLLGARRTAWMRVAPPLPRRAYGLPIRTSTPAR